MSGYVKRPSIKELYNKIKQGKEFVAQGNILPINPDAIAADAIELGYRATNLINILSELLDEVKIEHYIGAHPPRKSYESIIKGCELFEFKWTSRRLGFDLYLKYCLKEGILYIVSLHKDRLKEPRKY